MYYNITFKILIYTKIRSLEENQKSGRSFDFFREFIINPRDLIVKEPCKHAGTNFGYHYTDYKKEVNDQCSESLVLEMVLSIIVDSNYSYNLITGKSVTGLIGLITFISVRWFSKL